METKTRKITLAAICIAISTVLSFVQLTFWVNGGSVTLMAAVPIFIYAYKYGFKWGIFCGFTFGVVQAIIGIGGLKGITLLAFFMAIILDYLVAYACYGITGIFKNNKNEKVFLFACIIALFLRFICHFLSGFLIWGSLVTDGFGAIVYSFTYNISYMLPEAIINLVGGYFVFKLLKKVNFI